MWTGELGWDIHPPSKLLRATGKDFAGRIQTAGLEFNTYAKMWLWSDNVLLRTFYSCRRTVGVEFFTQRRVLLLELLQVVRQTENCGAQGLLLPLGTSTPFSTAAGRRARDSGALINEWKPWIIAMADMFKNQDQNP